MKYTTTAKSAINTVIKSFNTDFTAKELIAKLNQSGHNFGTATIYRHIDELESQHILRRVYHDNSTAISYWYSEPCNHDSHFDLHCTNCDRIFHVDCEHMQKFAAHVQQTHGFTMQAERVLVNGLCADCQATKEKENATQ